MSRFQVRVDILNHGSYFDASSSQYSHWDSRPYGMTPAISLTFSKWVFRYNEESHSQLMRDLFSSLFCPVIPGDSQTSQHLTERFIAGCIPVFVGPPFHTMPFEKEVDYSRSAVFLNVTNSNPWLRNTVMEWEFPMVPSEGWDHELLGLSPEMKDAENPKWWFPWVPTDMLTSIPRLEDIIPTLRAFPMRRIRALQRAVKRERTKFIYGWGKKGRPGALDIIVDNICHFVGRGCEPRAKF